MMRAIWVLVLAPLLVLSLAVPVAFALVNLTVSPSIIAPDDLVTISVCTTAHDHVKYISVTTPSGTTWNTTNPLRDFVPLTCPASTTVNFGGTSTGWVKTHGSGTTQTGEDGLYTVRVEFTHAKGATEEFNVNKQFSVPEFGVPALAVVAVSLLGLVMLRKAIQPNLI